MRLTRSQIAVRLFLTCWIVYALHFATNIVREIYPALAIGDHLSFRVDEYANMHPDLFEKPGYGWHIGNNPGASMVAAIPYALARPIIDPIVRRVQQRAGCERPDRAAVVQLAVADGARVLRGGVAPRLRHQVRARRRSSCRPSAWRPARRSASSRCSSCCASCSAPTGRRSGCRSSTRSARLCSSGPAI